MPARRTSASPLRLTQERIVDTALEIVRSSGYDSLSMRAVAAELDTGPASLYAHVANKTELDRLIISRVLLEESQPDDDPESWRECLADAVRAWRHQLAAYPGLAKAYFGSVPQDLASLDREEWDNRLLRLAGLDPRQTAVASVTLYLFAAARSIEDAVIDERIAESALTRDEWFAAARQLPEALPEQQFPYLREQLELLFPDFREWLATEAVELILDGIEARYLGGTRSAATASRSAE